MSGNRRWRRDDGQVGGIEAVPLAVLVFVVGALLVANAWAVVDAKLVVGAAAREAARAFAEASPAGGDAAAWAEAEAAASEALSAGGRRRDAASVRLVHGGALRRCEPVVVEVVYEVPAISLPWIGGFGRGLDVRARHGELVDPFRSGLEGSGCA